MPPAAADILHAASQYMQLRRTGRFYAGPCPFHPSDRHALIVYQDDDWFCCSECKHSGDADHFVDLMRERSL